MDKNTKIILGVAVVAVVGVASYFGIQGNLFQGNLGNIGNDCKKNPNAISSVTSWVPTMLTSYTPVISGSTAVTSKVKCNSGKGQGKNNPK